MGVLRVALFCFVCAAAAASPIYASPIYTVTHLGGTSAYSINDSGAAAGVVFSNGQQTGFLGS
ncbi:MAG: hypothetical protein ACRD4P_02165, partial [Bryobacteraceae bacterium]